VGLIQRVVEAAGMATISVSLSREITRKVRPPRAVFTGLPLGHPLGFPGQTFRQLQILRLLFKSLADITVPGTLLELDLSEPEDPSVHCPACGS
jgi:hypothetical protein